MDLFRRKCLGHNVVLKLNEPCPRCVEASRAQVYATEKRRDQKLAIHRSLDPERLGTPAAAPLAPRLNRNATYEPHACPHMAYFDEMRGVCHGCMLSTAELLALGYARRVVGYGEVTPTGLVYRPAVREYEMPPRKSLFQEQLDSLKARYEQAVRDGEKARWTHAVWTGGDRKVTR